MRFQATPFFNSTLLPARPRDFHGHGPKPSWTMDADRFEDTMQGTYRAGDHLVESMLSVVTDEESPEMAAHRTWHLLNIDERQNGKHERSLSVGDFVCVCPVDGEGAAVHGAEVWYLARPVGFELADDPTPTAEVERYEEGKVNVS